MFLHDRAFLRDFRAFRCVFHLQLRQSRFAALGLPAMTYLALPAHDSSLVARLLRDGYIWLHFPEPLESEFRTDHALTSRRWVRLGLLFAALASAGSALIDPWVIAAASPAAIIVRYGVQLPVFIVLLITTDRRLYPRWYEPAIQVGGPLFAAGTILMAGYAQAEHAALVGARLLLIAFYIYFMAGLRLPQALRTNLIILAALIAAGSVGILSASLTTFLAVSLASASLIGAAGSYALEHARRTAFLERKLLAELAELDGLTQLMNRHTFEVRARESWREAARARQPVSVAMLDVDHFKLYNDHYGHQAGDECLRHVARAVRSALACRPGELIARYGGEEIIALLVGRTRTEADEIAQRVVAGVASLNLAHVAPTDDSRVTISIGVATQCPPFADSFEKLVNLADGALYTAKHQGRNCAVAVEAKASVAA
jgi:diguanylate cyclase (GGDEF)-like protein